MSNPDIHFPTDVDILDLDSLEEQLSIVDDHIHREQEALQCLYPIQTELLRTLNSLQSATRHLPDETLSVIFRFVFSLPEDNDDDDSSCLGWGCVDSDNDDNPEGVLNSNFVGSTGSHFYDPGHYPDLETEWKDEPEGSIVEKSSSDGEEKAEGKVDVQVDHHEEEIESHIPSNIYLNDFDWILVPGSQLYREILGLAHVCFQWRRAALYTPELWNRLSLYVNRRLARVVPELLESHFINAGRLPLTMRIKLPGGIDDSPSGPGDGELPSHFLKSIQRTLFSSKSKMMEILWLDHLPLDWIPMIPVAFSQLKKLTLSNFECSEVDLRHLAQLQELSLNEVRATAILLPWSTITSLHLFRVSVAVCIDLLLRCSNLVRYSSLDAWRSEDGYNGFFRQPRRELDSAIWTKIEYFQWTYLLDPRCARLMTSIRFHCLKSLEWSRSPGLDTEESQKMTKTFFSNIPGSLSALTLRRQPAWPMSLYKYVFKRCTNVKSLRFQECTSSFAVRLLITLTPSSMSDPTRDPTLYLPLLRKLEIHGRLFEDTTDFLGIPIINLGRVSAPYLAAFLKARYRGPGSFFRLQTYAVRIIWTTSISEDLSYMINHRGYNLQFVYNDKERG